MNDATFVSHLECSLSGERFPADTVQNLSQVGKPLLVRYDLEALGQHLTKDTLSKRPEELWRYREFLPVRQAANRLSLGEPRTPLLTLDHWSQSQVTVKDESRLPTGSFKARGLCLAVSMAKELGIQRVAIPTNGNAGAALAAYGSLAGMESYVFCPEDTPDVNVREIALQGAHVWKVNGYIHHCGQIVKGGLETMGWFDFSTLKEPYRIEGKKTMGLELAEQLGWTVPDVIFYPTGGGTGLIGMWKAFAELEAIGWIDSKRPRMIAVQADGCAPIVRAFEDGAEFAEEWQDATTVASGIRVPMAIGDFLILRAVRESGGFAIAVSDDSILTAQHEIAAQEGLLLGPEGAATAAAYQKALKPGLVSPDESAVRFNCGTALKYPMPAVTATIDRHSPLDFSQLDQGSAGTPV
ncbi:MAG: threonine synthase [Verrucomicrobiaceae bacterium]|nr:threonine synthase [Verrucomicrobiaceae bacterium]